MPKSAKLAVFFQGHFIRFWNRGQAGNGGPDMGVMSFVRGARRLGQKERVTGER
jgi:hypothetical protein